MFKPDFEIGEKCVYRFEEVRGEPCAIRYTAAGQRSCVHYHLDNESQAVVFGEHIKEAFLEWGKQLF